MATTAGARDALYARLQDVLGHEEAQTLKELLPPEGFDALATKADIQVLDGRLSGVETTVSSLRDKVAALDDKVAGLDVKVAAIDDKVTGIDYRLVRLESRMDGLDQRMDGFDQRMGRFERYMETFDGRVHEFHTALREQTRTFIIASSTSTLLVAGVAFSAARLIQ